MNIADENASTKAVDSLLNYETVKYFNAEIMEADRFNKAMKTYEDSAVKAGISINSKYRSRWNNSIRTFFSHGYGWRRYSKREYVCWRFCSR